MRTVLDVTAMATWLGVSDTEMLDILFLMENGKIGGCNGELNEEAKKECVEAEGSINCLQTYCGTAAHFVRQIPDGLQQAA